MTKEDPQQAKAARARAQERRLQVFRDKLWQLHQEGKGVNDPEFQRAIAERDACEREHEEQERTAERGASSTPTVESAADRESRERAERRANSGIYSPKTILASPPQPQQWLVDAFLPMGAITLVVGDNPTLLLIQLGLCIASGTPFLGRSTPKGKVLFVEYISSPSEFEIHVGNVARFVGIPDVTDAEFAEEWFIRWNRRTAANYRGPSDIRQMIRDERPILTIINSLSHYDPHAQEKLALAVAMHNQFRDIISEIGGTIVLSHHYVKHRANIRATRERMIQQLKAETFGIAPLTHTNLCIFLTDPISTKADAEDEDDTDDTEFVIERSDQFGNAFPRIAVERVESDYEDLAVGYQEVDPQLDLKDKQILNRLPNPFYWTDLNAQPEFHSKRGTRHKNGEPVVNKRSALLFVERVGAVKAHNLLPDSRTRKMVTTGWWKPGTAPAAPPGAVGEPVATIQ